MGDKLKGYFFSFNVDEATNKAGDKFLNTIVQYCDEEGQTVRNQLLGTREVNIATSSNITSAVQEILSSNELNLNQLVSMSVDN